MAKLAAALAAVLAAVKLACENHSVPPGAGTPPAMAHRVGAAGHGSAGQYGGPGGRAEAAGPRPDRAYALLRAGRGRRSRFADRRGVLDATTAGQQYIAELLNRLIDQENDQ